MPLNVSHPLMAPGEGDCEGGCCAATVAATQQQLRQQILRAAALRYLPQLARDLSPYYVHRPYRCPSGRPQLDFLGFPTTQSVKAAKTDPKRTQKGAQAGQNCRPLFIPFLVVVVVPHFDP